MIPRLFMSLLVTLALVADGGVPVRAQDRADATSARGSVAPAITPAAIRAHLGFLAHDLLEGRAPGTRGEALTVRYLASHLARVGVEPVDGSYFQSVPLIGWRPDPERTSLRFSTPQGTVSPSYPQDAVVWLDADVDSVTARGELVFVGYGVEAPEYDWSDYKDRDVRGRIVVALSSDPPAPPGQPMLFDGPALTYYGRYTYKIEEALRQGAAGVLIVHTVEGAGYGWDVVRNSWTNEQVALPTETSGDDVASNSLGAPVQGWIRYDAISQVLEPAGHDVAELYVRAARRDFQPVFTGVVAELTAVGSTRRFNGTNVVGIVNGTHEARGREAVVYTAHHDHLGIGRPIAGDSIYNGAYDNASGVALLLEVASAFASLDPKPERSVLFLFTAAEEPGMLGASWYVRNPVLPIDRTVAVLNIDGANIWGETEDVSAVGLERSTLGVTFERQAEALGLRVTADRAPGQGLFFRSDQFPFARAGVPALYISHGTSFRGRTREWSDSILTVYQSERYHRPADQYGAVLSLAGAVQQARHAFLVGLDVARTAARPRIYREATTRSGGR